MRTVIVNSLSAFYEAREWINQQTRLGFDIEATDLDYDKLELVGFGMGNKEVGYYFPLAHEIPDPSMIAQLQLKGITVTEADYVNFPFDDGIEFLKQQLQRQDILWVVHNLKYEEGALNEYGILITSPKVCTMLASWIQKGRGQNGLADCVRRSPEHSECPGLGISRSSTKFDDLVSDFGGNIKYVPVKPAGRYCATDCSDTFRLYDEKYEKALAANGATKVFRELECTMPRILSHMERTGIRFDYDTLLRVDEEMAQEIVDIDERLFEIVGREFNVGSRVQLSDLVFDGKRQLLTPYGERGKNGRFSVKSAIIAQNFREAQTDEQRELALLLLRRSKLATLRSRYTVSLYEAARHHRDMRVHGSFNQGGTGTGRLSSSGPNLQNMPRPGNEENIWERGLPNIRAAVLPRPGFKFVGGDYSQVELRVMAHESRDPRLIQAYRNGEDIHQLTATQCGCVRQDAKAINFGLIYLMSPHTLAGQINKSIPEAERYHRAYFAAYSGVRQYHDLVKRVAMRDGRVRTIAGRWRKIDDLHSSHRGKARAAWRRAVNTRIQGSAADIIKIAMRNLWNRFDSLGWNDNVVFWVLQVHDELILEVHEDYAERARDMMQEEFENAVKLRVPLVCTPSIGDSWAEVK